MWNFGITVHGDNPNYSSLDGVLYNKDKTALIQYPCGRAGALVIPASVTSVGIAAFELCSVVTSITFTGNVESIAEAAFESLTGLTSITFPSSLTSIGRWAFWGDTNLTAAYFYGNAPVLGVEVFDYCASGFTVYYLAGSTGFANPWYGYPTEVFDPSPTTTTTTQPSTTTTTIAVGPGTTTTTRGGPCPAQNVLGEDSQSLEKLRALRDGPLAKSAVGRRITKMYYNNADSINTALDRSPALRSVARRVFELIAPMVDP